MKKICLLAAILLCLSACSGFAETLFFLPQEITDAFNQTSGLSLTLQEIEAEEDSEDEPNVLYANEDWNLALLFYCDAVDAASDRCFLWISAECADADAQKAIASLASVVAAQYENFDAQDFVNWSKAPGESPAYYHCDVCDIVCIQDEISTRWLFYGDDD